jgi:hypothetical protein
LACRERELTAAANAPQGRVAPEKPAGLFADICAALRSTVSDPQLPTNARRCVEHIVSIDERKRKNKKVQSGLLV